MIRVVALMLATPTMAESPLIGTWCAEGNGIPTFYVEADGLGVNENTLCDWRDPPNGLGIKTVIDCRNVYLHDGQVVETDHQTLEFTAEMRADGALLVQVADDEPIVTRPCDD